MRSSNPVFSRRGFSRDNGYAGFNAAPQAGAAAAQRATRTRTSRPSSGNPYATNPYAQQDPQHGAPPQAPASPPAAMTIDDVVTRTAMTLGTVVVTAALAWALLPVDDANIGRSYGIAIGAALVAMVLALVQSFKRKAVARADPDVRGASRVSSSASISSVVDTTSRAARPCRPCSARMAVFAARTRRVQDAAGSASTAASTAS